MVAIHYELTKEELQFEAALQTGDFVQIENFEQRKKKLENTAKKSLERKRVTIRIPGNVLEKIQGKAKKLGMPYQTLINSVLHQFTQSES